MTITCTKEHLLFGLSSVERAVKRTATLPALTHVAMTAKPGRLVLSGTDLEIGVVTAIPAKVEEEGAFTLPLRPLLSFVASLPDDTVQLRRTGKHILLKTATLQGKVQSGNLDEFPIIPDLSTAESIRLNAREVIVALEAVLPAAATTDTRPELTGISLTVDAGRLNIAATDTFRLALRTLPYEHHEIFSIILPQRSAQEIARLFKNADSIDVRIAENQISVSDKNAVFTSRLLEGAYPDYRAILPAPQKIRARIERQNFLMRLEAATPFTGRLNDVKLAVSQNGEAVRIGAEHPDVGSYETEIISAEHAGDERTVSCNLRYLLDGMRGMKSDELVLEFFNDAKPIVLRAGDRENEDCYLLMPIRLS